MVERLEPVGLREERLLRSLAIANVDEHVHATDEGPGAVEEGRRIGDEGNPRAVGPLCHGFGPPDRPASP